MNGRADVFRTIVAGVSKHKDTQLVLSIGEQLDPKQIGPAPSNAIIVNQAPQLRVAEADLGLHHARWVKYCVGVSGSGRSAAGPSSDFRSTRGGYANSRKEYRRDDAVHKAGIGPPFNTSG
jgi:hypothetical protein